MKKIILAIICVIVAATTTYAKPRCHGFNNYDDKVTIVLVDDKAGDKYMVTEAVLSTGSKKYEAKSVKTDMRDGVAVVTLTFPHATQFSNPKLTLRVNGKKMKVKICQ